MAPPKKMSLEEFISDDSYGGSWADDEIDIASISVPIEKNKSLGSSEGGYYGGGFGRSRVSGVDNGPPYIVKLLHLPVSCDDGFVTDLFKSRFMSFVKFKIVFDPSSNPLETGVVRKSAFVELHSFSDQNKVVAWQDLFYKGNRRVIIELADFSDFQYCMDFNQQNERDLRRVEREFLANKSRGGLEGRRSSHGAHIPGLGILGELEELRLQNRDQNRANGPGRRGSFGPVRSRSPPLKPISRFTSAHTATPKTIDPLIASPALVPPKPKPNPFGNAKPVDIVAKEHELDKKVVVIDQNTITALSSDSETASLHETKGDGEGTSRANSSTKASEKGSGANALSPAPIPSSVYNQKKSLADILSSKPDSDMPVRAAPIKGRKSASSTPKPQGKPVILKKKPFTVSSPAHQRELERLGSPEVITLEANGEPDGAAKVEESKNSKLSQNTEAKEPAVADKATSPEKEITDVASINSEQSIATPKENTRQNSRRKSSTRSKSGSISEPSNKADVSEERTPKTQHHLTERNKSFSSQQRPDFRKSLIEMTSGADEKERPSSRRGRGRGRGGRGGSESGRRGDPKRRSSETRPERRPSEAGNEGSSSEVKVERRFSDSKKERKFSESKNERRSSEHKNERKFAESRPERRSSLKGQDDPKPEEGRPRREPGEKKEGVSGEREASAEKNGHEDRNGRGHARGGRGRGRGGRDGRGGFRGGSRGRGSRGRGGFSTKTDSAESNGGNGAKSAPVAAPPATNA